jgi:hypothetical protein
MPIKGYNSSRYFITFIYDWSRLSKVYVIKSRGEIFDCLMYFKKHYKRLDLG